MDMDLESQWMQFMSEDFNEHEMNSYSEQLTITTHSDGDSDEHNSDFESDDSSIPQSSELNISTKTKIVYLNSRFDLDKLFWKIRTIDYDSESEGIIKKQMKFNFTNPSEVEEFEKNILNERRVCVKILNQINNPTGRVVFKDVRKVDIGFCKNDIINPKKKSKSAFYNCFVIIFRKMYLGKFTEFHVKLFNSGKVEVPGIQSDDMLNVVVDTLLEYIQPFHTQTISEIKSKREIILVNSNFNCNYYLNREKLVHILKKKYKIKCNMDSCSYPGIQCKYKLDNGSEISFMIFRTGSVLIVGKCDDDQLNCIYTFLVNMFKDEYRKIREYESELEKEEKRKQLKGKKKNKKSLTIYV